MRRRRPLSEEERRLWAEIARTARPLPGKTAPPLELALEPPPAPGKQKRTHALEPEAVPTPMPRPTPAKTRHALHPIERPVRRRIGAGRIPLEGRIDLHGQTEAAAHFTLLAFLRRAQGSGMRHVLVITGRGASFGSRGVLKRALPHWFATGEFRALVAGYEPAERHHGGDGAFYVRVRRP